MLIRQYPTLPPAPSRGPLPPMMSVVIPLARTNLITNPSFETNTTGWSVTGGGASIARSATRQYHGVYSLAVTAANFGASAIYQPTLTAGTTYAFSFKIYNATIGRSHAISICTNAGVTLATYTFTSTGRWQWVSVIYTATSTATHQLRATLNTLLVSDTFYIDGAQLEAITDGVLAATTYIDGDQLGLLVGQQPPAYGWNGTPHASTSYRTALTRAGGYLVNLATYNFLLTGLIGLGMAAPNNVSIPYTVLDGARYQRTTKPPRAIALAGRVQDDDPFGYQAGLANLRAAFDRDLIPLQQPLVLQIEPMDACGTVIGDFANIPCIYAGGLEGNDGNVPVEDVAPTFTMYVPYLVGGDAGAALTVQQTVTNANYILQRSPAGVWSAMGTGAAGNPVLALARGLDGKIYAGGAFTSMGGVANTANIAVWDPTTATWAAMGTGATGGNVLALTVGADGSVYAGGTFTGMGGVANTNNIARWTGSAWAAMGTGVTTGSTVSALVAAPDGYVYAGGDFTQMGGVANTTRIARWNGSAWSALSTGAAASVETLAWGPNGLLYVGGAFTTIGGVAINRIATWNGTAFATLTSAGGANNTVRGLAFAPSGILYMVGSFTQVGGQTTGTAAQWNGTAWSAVSSYYGSTMQSVAVSPTNVVYFGAGGAFSGAPGWLPDPALTRYIGNDTILGLDIDLPSTNVTAYDWLFLPDGTLIIAFSSNGSATSAAITSVTNTNKGYSWPILTINGPSSGTSRIYQYVNYTTGFSLYFDLTLSAGEVATLRFDPQNPAFTTTFQGDITSKILPGSQPALLYLAPGTNSISFFAASSTVVATPAWQKRYNGAADLVN